MGYSRRGLMVMGMLTAILLQACTLTPKLPDPDQKTAVMERWNRCLQRFETNVTHFCDGHRRDVLALFPSHLESQVDALLRLQSEKRRPPRLVNTGTAFTLDAYRPTDQNPKQDFGTRAE